MTLENREFGQIQKADNGKIIPFPTRSRRALPRNNGLPEMTKAEVRKILLGINSVQEPAEIITFKSRKELDEQRVYGKPWL